MVELPIDDMPISIKALTSLIKRIEESEYDDCLTLLKALKAVVAAANKAPTAAEEDGGKTPNHRDQPGGNIRGCHPSLCASYHCQALSLHETLVYETCLTEEQLDFEEESEEEEPSLEEIFGQLHVALAAFIVEGRLPFMWPPIKTWDTIGSTGGLRFLEILNISEITKASNNELAEKVSYIVGAGRMADVGIAGGLRVLWG